MKAGKVSDVSFDVHLIPDDQTPLRLVVKDGELCLSLSGLLLKEKNIWYELPLRDIKDVIVIENDEAKLKFVLEDLEVIVKGKNPAHLRALRHLLLPLIDRPENT